MTLRSAAMALVVLLAPPATAQGDEVTLVNGTVVTGVRVTAWDVRVLKYSKDGAEEQVPADQVAKVELQKFADVYRRALRDPDLLLKVARERLAEKDLLLAQLGFVRSAAQFFDAGKPREAIAALEEMQKALPTAGVLPDAYRQKFEYYMGQGGKGAGNAVQVARKFAADAAAGGWPGGFAVEADFLLALADRRDPKSFQGRLRAIVAKAVDNPIVCNRARVELAHSLRETKDVDGARSIYEEIRRQDGADANSRAGAYLGLGKILMDGAPAGDKDAFKNAMLLFLRVWLETKDAGPSLQAEALYLAPLAAEKWKGPEYNVVVGRCRGILLSRFAESEWAEKARKH